MLTNFMQHSRYMEDRNMLRQMYDTLEDVQSSLPISLL
jgi:hypothetical protein